MSARLTPAQFIARHGLTAHVTRAERNPNVPDAADMDHWRVELRRYDGQYQPGDKHHPCARMAVYFSMGAGHRGAPPELAAALECLASDSAGIEADYANWCAELGYDTDSRQAHRTYTICRRQAERLQKFLGAAAYAELLAVEW